MLVNQALLSTYHDGGLHGMSTVCRLALYQDECSSPRGYDVFNGRNGGALVGLAQLENEAHEIEEIEKAAKFLPLCSMWTNNVRRHTAIRGVEATTMIFPR